MKGQKILLKNIENEIFDWIMEIRNKKLVVTRKDVKEQAILLTLNYDVVDSFAASNHWLSNLMLRYELSLRKSNTLFKISDVEIATRAVSFINFIDKLPISSYLASDIIALDETAIYIGIPQKSTIERRGKSTVSIQST